MDLSFSSKELRSLCERKDAAVKKFGEVAALKLRTRLADLIAARCYLDLPLGNPRIIAVNRVEYLVVDFDSESCLTFAVGHPKPPLIQDGITIDWVNVYRLRLIGIGPKHDADTRISA